MFIYKVPFTLDLSPLLDADIQSIFASRVGGLTFVLLDKRVPFDLSLASARLGYDIWVDKEEALMVDVNVSSVSQ